MSSRAYRRVVLPLIQSSPAAANEIARIAGLLPSKFKPIIGRRVGIVETFGTVNDSGQPWDGPGDGNNLAALMNILIRHQFPSTFGQSAFDCYHDIEPAKPRGGVAFKIYIFTR